MVQRSDDEVAQAFAEIYRIEASEALLQLERESLGSDYGVTGWTSPDEADDIARRLDLGPADRLLDLGSGRGWPGLYLARTTGCDLVLADEPLDGLRAAFDRARRDGLSDVVAVAARGEALPLRPGSVDAVIHTDVLC